MSKTKTPRTEALCRRLADEGSKLKLGSSTREKGEWLFNQTLELRELARQLETELQAMTQRATDAELRDTSAAQEQCLIERNRLGVRLSATEHGKEVAEKELFRMTKERDNYETAATVAGILRDRVKSLEESGNITERKLAIAVEALKNLEQYDPWATEALREIEECK